MHEAFTTLFFCLCLDGWMVFFRALAMDACRLEHNFFGHRRCGAPAECTAQSLRRRNLKNRWWELRREKSVFITHTRKMIWGREKEFAGIIVIINTFEYMLLIWNRPSAKWCARAAFRCSIENIYGWNPKHYNYSVRERGSLWLSQWIRSPIWAKC